MDKKSSRTRSEMSSSAVEALSSVLDNIHDSNYRNELSLVCRELYQKDKQSRKHVTIQVCYMTTPQQLLARFQSIESLKLKGRPRANLFSLLPESWGGSVTPWTEFLAKYHFIEGLKSLIFRRMTLTDSDLEKLGSSRGNILQEIKFSHCSGFSTDGLLHIGRYCTKLKSFSLEESSLVYEKDGEWLHYLASNNKSLETLNFYKTDFSKVQVKDLEMMAKNCPSLKSLRVGECETLKLQNFFRHAAGLEEFRGGFFDAVENNSSLFLPQKLSSLGLSYLGRNEMPMVLAVASKLKKLDLLYTLLDTEDHRTLIERCSNLEALEARSVLGDRGLQELARSCKKLRKLRIERGAEDEDLITQEGVMALAQGCLKLEHLVLYVSDITNETLECIGTYSKNLLDFRIVQIDGAERARCTPDLQLDSGVRALLRGCDKLERLALCLRPGSLTDLGFSYVGQYSQNVRWMLLCCLGQTTQGLLAFSTGCPRLEELEMMNCVLDGDSLTTAVRQLRSLRHMWVGGNNVSALSHETLASMAQARPSWIFEFLPHIAQIVGYHSVVAEQRTDLPDGVLSFQNKDGQVVVSHRPSQCSREDIGKDNEEREQLLITEEPLSGSSSKSVPSQ